MTDYLVAHRTPKGTIAIDVLFDPGPSWRKGYGVGILVFELRGGEAARMSPTDLQSRINIDNITPARALEEWRRRI